MGEKTSSSFDAVGARIRELREAFGYNQREFAALIDSPYQAVNNWESGRSRPALEAGERIAERFGVSLDYIYFGKLRGLSHETVLKLSARRGEA